MINSPNSPPPGSGPVGPGSTPPAEESKKKPPGRFHFTKSHEFLHMTFTPEQWDKLMNICLQNLGDFINKTFQKTTEKLKKDWKRGQGDDPGD